jgi:flagellar biosynthesis protein FlhA
MADYANMTQDSDILTEYVRHALSRSLSTAYIQPDGMMSVITLDRKVEDAIQSAIQHRERGSYLALDPKTAQKILDNLNTVISSITGGQQPVLLVLPQIRPHVRRLTERYFPNLAVLSHNEITSQVRIQSIGTVTIDAS